MDQDKPFKTIEVVDGRTKQVCKIACMSCIRGHRTTSCGIPVCRQKIFWTVKRPGRPSNSCTCRYGSTGGCKCVTAIPKCPHKSKKGEKRSSECRCDEQGRYCCLLEPEHWDVLFQLQKPTIDFFASREALEGGPSAQTPMTMPSTPAYFAESTPHRGSSCCGTPAPTPQSVRHAGFPPTPYSDAMSPKSTGVTARFGFMGIGGPMGSADGASPDPLAWTGTAPPAPRDYSGPPESLGWNAAASPALINYSGPPEALPWAGTASPAPMDYATPAPYQQPPMEESSCCSGPATQIPHYQEPEMEIEENSCCQSSQAPLEGPQDFSLGDPFMQNTHINPFEPAITQPPYQPPYVQPIFDFDRWTREYQAYQYPGAICQKCGLNGCTCRNCPPVMQNYGTTSWAQCCGRKHARQGPQALPIHQHEAAPPAQMQPNAHPLTHQQPVDFGFPTQHLQQQRLSMHTMSPPPNQPQEMNGFDHNFDMPDATDPVAYSDFLLDELDRPSHTHAENGFGC